MLISKSKYNKNT